MPDEPAAYVATVRQGEWAEWAREQLESEPDAILADGTRVQWLWCSRTALARRVRPGDLFYIVSEGRLRCRAEIHRTYRSNGWTCALRRGDLEPVTVDDPIPGFRGLRRRWWPPEVERPCPDWLGAGLGLEG